MKLRTCLLPSWLMNSSMAIFHMLRLNWLNLRCEATRRHVITLGCRRSQFRRVRQVTLPVSWNHDWHFNSAFGRPVRTLDAIKCAHSAELFWHHWVELVNRYPRSSQSRSCGRETDGRPWRTTQGKWWRTSLVARKYWSTLVQDWINTCQYWPTFLPFGSCRLTENISLNTNFGMYAPFKTLFYPWQHELSQHKFGNS
jgi:hypothetical protein